MKKALLITALASTLGLADFVGGEVNLGYYNHTASGDANYKGDTIDLDKDLNWDSQGDIFIKAYLEHPVPIIPNIKLGYTDFSHSAEARSKDIEFGDTLFDGDAKINSDFNIKMYDITLYYELLDMLWMNFDMGVNIKYMDGDISLKGYDGSHRPIYENADFTLPIPMLYAKARVDIPSTDVSVQIEGNYIGYDGNTLMDLEMGVRYTFALGLGVELGYKTFELEIDDVDDFNMNADFSGVYGKAVWDF